MYYTRMYFNKIWNKTLIEIKDKLIKYKYFDFDEPTIMYLLYNLEYDFVDILYDEDKKTNMIARMYSEELYVQFRNDVLNLSEYKIKHLIIHEIAHLITYHYFNEWETHDGKYWYICHNILKGKECDEYL